jgi:hypothetical protein
VHLFCHFAIFCCSAWPDETHNPYLEKMTRRVEHITTLLASSSKGEADKFMVRIPKQVQSFVLKQD